jgi:hypothetical protein
LQVDSAGALQPPVNEQYGVALHEDPLVANPEQVLVSEEATVHPAPTNEQ